MKVLYKVWCILLCMIMLAAPMHAFAEDGDDPYADAESEIVLTTTQPATTAPYQTQPAEITAVPTATRAPKPVDPPLVKITRENLSKKPKPNETFTVTVIFHNYSGDVSLKNGLASFEPSDGLALAENSASKVVPVIEANSVRSLQIKLRVLKDAAANQSVSVNYTYSYRTPDGLQQAETTEKLILTVVPAPSTTEKKETATPASATPNIIVTGYDYGDTIAAGDAFTLKLQFQNTSRKLTAENIVMSIGVGEGIAITSASNTYYYASLGAGSTRSQSIPMRVTTNAEAEGAKIEISFHYEYVDKDTRSEASSTERLSIPIYIPDRFKISEPDMELVGTQNEEISLSLPYVNKGRISANNVSARLIYDEDAVSCEQPLLHIGNIESGKSGSIDLFFTPLTVGNGSVKVEITYEDELMQEKKVEIHVPYSAEEGYSDFGTEEFEDIPEEKTGLPLWLQILILAAVVIVVVIIIVIIVRKRKKKKNAAEPTIDFDWNASQEVGTHEDQ